MNSKAVINCPACLNEKSVKVGAKNDYTINQCIDCQTLFAEVTLENEKTADELQNIYEHYYDSSNFSLRPVVENSLQKAVSSFENFRKTGRFLDMGFGEGGLLSVAEKNGWDCYGTERSPQSLIYGAERNWKVSEDALNDSRFPKNEFDVVTLIEVIEHVSNPDDFLQAAFSLLRPNGLLYMTTPNMQSINRRLLGIDWSVVCPPEHITIWSPAGMEKALKRNNFTLRKVRTEGFNPVEILARLRTKKNGKVSVSRNEAAFALNEAFNSSSWRRAVKTTINRGLSTFRLGDSLKVWAVKN